MRLNEGILVLWLWVGGFVKLRNMMRRHSGKEGRLASWVAIQHIKYIANLVEVSTSEVKALPADPGGSSVSAVSNNAE